MSVVQFEDRKQNLLHFYKEMAELHYSAMDVNLNMLDIPLLDGLPEQIKEDYILAEAWYKRAGSPELPVREIALGKMRELEQALSAHDSF